MGTIFDIGGYPPGNGREDGGAVIRLLLWEYLTHSDSFASRKLPAWALPRALSGMTAGAIHAQSVSDFTLNCSIANIRRVSMRPCVSVFMS